ncbi:EF-hand domain-containing protein [Allosphingosinicella vermicomposti]|uniref:EF-hand domain-containing protein n=1 Tax=Allosphingosinicella vermicomposti TaxID=614671 RepID=UPI000D0FF340|nr:EF-hand domain-containing protein [Allosphingosinicella vermicomposti]
MGRFLAGVGSALLLVLAGFFIWKSQAESENPVPSAPQPRAAVPLLDTMVEPPSAPEKSREEKRFARYDKDKNGTITRAEMLETRRKPFQKLDKNGDGKLSFEEWAVATSDKFAKADVNRDGTLNAAEFLTTKPKPAKKKKCAC